MQKQGRTPARQPRLRFVGVLRHGSERDRKDPRPFLKATVCGKRKVKCLALVDTGADGVYVSPGLARKAGLEKIPVFSKARGRRIYTLQAARGQVCVKGLPCCKVLFDVRRPWVREGFQLILGCDWISTLGCVIDVGGMRLLRGKK